MDINLVVLGSQRVLVLIATRVEQDAKAVELTKIHGGAVALPFVSQIVFIPSTIITQHSKTIGIPRSLRQGTSHIPVIASVVHKKSDCKIVSASLRDSVAGKVVIVSRGII